jgi:hypothetical protein
MAQERYEIELSIGGVDQAVRSIQSVSAVVDKLGIGGGAAGGGFDISQFARAAAIASVVTVVIAALRKLGEAVAAAVSRIGDFGGLQATLGSTSTQTAFLRVIGSAFGVDVGGAASGVRQAVRSGLGAAAGVGFGVQPGQLDIGTAVNEGEMLLKVLKGIRQKFQSGDQGGALADARNLKVDKLFEFVYLTNEQIEQLNREAARTGGVFDQQQIAKAAQFKFELARVKEGFADLGATLGLVFLPFLRKVFEFLKKETTNPTGPGGIFGTNRSPQVQMSQALQGNTAALNSNTAELRAMSGIYGGGPRLRSAIPAAFGPGGGFLVPDSIRSSALRAGAFAL